MTRSPSDRWQVVPMAPGEQAAAQQRYRESLRVTSQPPREGVPLWLQPWLVLAWCVSVGLLTWCVIGGCR